MVSKFSTQIHLYLSLIRSHQPPPDPIDSIQLKTVDFFITRLQAIVFTFLSFLRYSSGYVFALIYVASFQDSPCTSFMYIIIIESFTTIK